MEKALGILVTKSSDSKSITVTDTTDWLDVGGTINDLTSITLNFYTESLNSPNYIYTFTENDLNIYITPGSTITFSFETLFDREFALDNWYKVQMVANEGDYSSNYDGFGTHVSIENKLYTSYINGLATPERDVTKMGTIYFNFMALKGLSKLDNSTYASRDVKYKKRLSALVKSLS